GGAVRVDVAGAVQVDVGAAGMPPPPSPHAASTQSMARTAGKRIRRASLSEKPRVKPTDVHTEARSHGEDLRDSVPPSESFSSAPIVDDKHVGAAAAGLVWALRPH